MENVVRSPSDPSKPGARQSLIEVGRRLLVEEGEEGLPSIVAVCEQAGCSRSFFYAHFLDRNEYAIELLDSVLGELVDAFLCDAFQGGFDLTQRVRHLADVVGGPLSPEVAELRGAYLVVLGSLDDHERLRKHHAEAIKRVIDLIESTVRCELDAGRLRTGVEPRGTAEFLMLVAFGSVLWADTGVPMDTEGLGDGLVAVLEPPPNT